MDKLDRERVAIRHRRRGNVAARSHLAGPLLSPYNSTVLRVPPSFFTAPSKPSSTAPPAVPQMPPVPPPYTTQPQSSGIGSLVPAELAAREFWARNFGSESMPVPMAQLLQAMMETMEPNAAVRWTEAIQRRLSVMLGRRSVDGDEVANDDRSDWFGSLRRLRGSAASRTGTARSSVSRWRYALTNTHEEKAKRPLEESIDTVSIHEFTTMMELRGDETVSEMVKSFASAAESLAHVEEPREGGKGALFSQGRKTVRKKDSDRSLRSVASFVAEGNEDEKGADISTTAIALPAESIATEGLGVSSGPTPATMFAEAAAHLARESFDEARDLLLQTAHHHNHAESMFLLGHMWETGRGVPAPDADASRGWYRKAGNAGYEKAFDRLRDLNAKAFPFLRPMRDGEEHISIDEFLDEKMSVALADEIASNTATKSLRYTAEKSTGQASKPNFAALAQALQKNKTLTELQLRGIRISNQSAEALAAALSEHPSLKVLDLSDNRIGSDGSRAISQALSKNKSNISSLNLSGNAIGNTGAEDLAEMLTKCETLEELHLSLNMISDIGASAIGKALPKSSLKRLVLSENHIGDAGAKEVARGLEIGSRLTSLDLSANWIGTVGAASIAKSLNENSRLQNLELGRNKLGDAGAKAFAESLVTNENLMSLDLSHNKIGDSGGKALAEMITRNNSLILLILAENHMTGIDVCGYGYGVTNTLKRVARERKMTVQVKQASPKQGIFGWICGCLRV
ncbi:hypothetical protein DFJ73DRAFT_152358 [Zopfochytrium polystomum]|nr:hypothetical protein DFJ73DRAFT_152358 [Zopfochytrium polystomum]